ncbi:MAG: hypothetical protein HC845_05180 [Akkermansiaceae bacterium]|nr:hypothetical protein [Akkermansiaceae bacterium]
MKSIIHQITSAAFVFLAIAVSTPQVRAADLTLEGSGYYDLDSDFFYVGGRGASQSGRYRNLGRDYYHETAIGMDEVVNNSRSRSGTMSFEFWGLDFFGADSGFVLMTSRVKSLGGGRFYDGIDRVGNSIFLDEYRFPELNLYELTRSGWRYRDSLSFSEDSLL